MKLFSISAGFTACEGQMRSDGRIQFTSVKSSHGISMISSYRDGKFIAPKAGFYLVLSNILSNSQQGFFIRKNGTEIAMAWSHHRDLNTISLYNAPLLAFTELSVNDVITIEGQSLDHSSCLTIVQLWHIYIKSLEWKSNDTQHIWSRTFMSEYDIISITNTVQCQLDIQIF